MKNTDEFELFQRDHVRLNATRREDLNKHMGALHDFLRDNLPGFRTTERQGSHALGTIIRPTTDDAKADADLLVLVKYSTDDHSSYIPQLARTLMDSDRYRDKVEVKNKCATVHYSERSKLEVDLVPCVESGGRYYICPRNGDGFQETDGTGYREWFKGKNQITDGNLRRVVRLLKYSRDHMSGFECPSIVLTTLAAETIKESDRDTVGVSTQADALATILDRMSEKLDAAQHPPAIVNPALPSEEFEPKWSSEGYSRFKKFIRQMASDAKSALQENDKEKSIALWRKIFGEKFGGGNSGGGNSGGGNSGGGNRGGSGRIMAIPALPREARPFG